MEIWPKETSTCNCLLRKARNKWREPAKVWIDRMITHYKKESKCLDIVRINTILLESSKEDHSKICASMWQVDETKVSFFWG